MVGTLASPSKTPAVPRVEDKTLALLAAYGEDKKKTTKWVKEAKAAIIENERLIAQAGEAVREANKRIGEAGQREMDAQIAWGKGDKDLNERTEALNAQLRDLATQATKQAMERKASLDALSLERGEVVQAAGIIHAREEAANIEDARQKQVLAEINKREKALDDGERQLNVFWVGIRKLIPSA